MAFPICIAKMMASPDQGITCTFLTELGSQITTLGAALLLSQGKKADSKNHLLINIIPKLNHLVTLTRQLYSPFYSFTWIRNQASIPLQLFSASSTPPRPDLRIRTIASPKTDSNMKPTFPRILTANTPRNLTNLNDKDLFYQSKIVKSGRGA